MGSTVYLLHFSRAYHHARHYLGTAASVHERVKQHRAGQGARLLQFVLRAGIDLVLARVWEGGRELERRLKRWHNGAHFCPFCRRRLLRRRRRRQRRLLSQS
jgi:hypothetical protein